jgi:hypothetical protein
MVLRLAGGRRGHDHYPCVGWLASARQTDPRDRCAGRTRFGCDGRGYDLFGAIVRFPTTRTFHAQVSSTQPGQLVRPGTLSGRFAPFGHWSRHRWHCPAIKQWWRFHGGWATLAPLRWDLDEEEPHAPRLVGQRIHDLKATPRAWAWTAPTSATSTVIWGTTGTDASRAGCWPGGRVARGHKGHDQPMSMATWKPCRAGVEVAARIRLIGGDVGQLPTGSETTRTRR